MAERTARRLLEAGSARLQRLDQALAGTMRRLPMAERLGRAAGRYDSADGGRLAAAVTYYAFFAAFAMALLAFASLGYVLDNPAVLASVQSYLSQNLPRLNVESLVNARSTVGAVALLVLPVAGLFWVDVLRSSIRAIWRLPQYPGTFLARQLIDLAILAGLCLLLATTLALAVGSTTGLRWVLVDVVGAGGSGGEWLVAVVGFVLGGAINTMLAVAVLTAVPRIRMRLARVLGPALLVAAGLEILKTLGRIYVQRTEANPAYHAVAGAVGLLVFLNILNQLLLFAAALTATSTAGPIVDLSAGPPSPSPPSPRRPASLPPPPRRFRDRLRSWVTRRRPIPVTDHNKRLVTEFFSALSAGNLEQAFAMVAEHATWWIAGDLAVSGNRSKAQYLARQEAIQAEFVERLSYQVQELVAEGDRVAAEIVVVGDHINGKRYQNHSHLVFTVEAGLIVAVSEYLDTKHLHDLVA